MSQPLILPNGQLFINTKSDWGEVIVEVLEADSDSIEGMRLVPVSTDDVRLQVQWPTGNSLKRLAGKPVRLRFILKNALLYSWKVE